MFIESSTVTDGKVLLRSQLKNRWEIHRPRTRKMPLCRYFTVKPRFLSHLLIWDDYSRARSRHLFYVIGVLYNEFRVTSDKMTEIEMRQYFYPISTFKNDNNQLMARRVKWRLSTDGIKFFFIHLKNKIDYFMSFWSM